MTLLTENSPAFKAAALRQLATHLRGEALLPDDSGYDAARRIWNGMIDRRPALIARCVESGDVIQALRFAREHDLPVSVRGGGHNVAGTAVCDGGVMIDLSPMKGIQVDPALRTARAEPGLTWGDLDRATQAFGLATPGGIVSTTGIAGFTLGGGFGWLSRKHGFACDNLLSADVVTADGQLLTATADRHADLFWGLRGGGGNFGIVTSFTYQLHEVGPTVLGGTAFYRLERTPQVMRAVRDLVAHMPDELFIVLGLVQAPASPLLPPTIHGAKAIKVMVCYAGPIEEGERLLQPIRALQPEVDLIAPMPYVTLQSMLDAGVPPGFHQYWKSDYLMSLDDPAIDTIVEYIDRLTSPRSQALIGCFGGALARIPDDSAAVSNRAAPYIINVNAMWERPEESDVHITWARDFWAAMRPFSTGGVYVNFLGNEGEDRVRAAYGARKYERLVALKDRYDPENVFRLNQNIRPSGQMNRA